MKKYNSIDQFRHVIKEVRMRHDFKGVDEDGKAIYEHASPYPILTFKGTTKVHGTNGGIVLYKDGSIKIQSRNRELSLGSDNKGFYSFIKSKDITPLFEGLDFKEYIAIYGEWCGGNIQKGVAIQGLPAMFIIFDVVVDGVYLNDYSSSLESEGVYNVKSFGEWEVDIDFNNPEKIQNVLIEHTLKVEEECPVGKYFGKSGIGEGIVFHLKGDRSVKFKSKGEKHSSSKVRVINAIDTEVLKKVEDFVTYACTVNRLTQGLEHVPSRDIKYTGEFIKWVCKDVLKEEEDTLIASGLEWKKVAGLISKKASEFFRS